MMFVKLTVEVTGSLEQYEQEIEIEDEETANAQLLIDQLKNQYPCGSSSGPMGRLMRHVPKKGWVTISFRAKVHHNDQFKFIFSFPSGEKTYYVVLFLLSDIFNSSNQRNFKVRGGSKSVLMSCKSSIKW